MFIYFVVGCTIIFLLCSNKSNKTKMDNRYYVMKHNHICSSLDELNYRAQCRAHHAYFEHKERGCWCGR